MLRKIPPDSKRFGSPYPATYDLPHKVGGEISMLNELLPNLARWLDSQAEPGIPNPFICTPG